MESPFDGSAPYAPYPGPLKTNTTAIVSLIASVAGFVCFFWGVGGILGLVLGFIARAEIRRSGGREAGGGLALGGIILGGLNLALVVALFSVGIAQLAIASRKVSLPPTLPPAPLGAPAPPTHPKPHKKAAERKSREPAAITVTRVGAITLANFPDSPGDLATNLDAQRADASATSETLLLWLVQPNCKPCDGLSAALPDKRVQAALAHVRLLRVDVHVYQSELEALAIPIEKIPGFALLDAHNHATDFIHGGEWDADIAANIAPILGKFVRGTYTHRREPWHPEHGERGDDETPI